MPEQVPLTAPTLHHWGVWGSKESACTEIQKFMCDFWAPSLTFLICNVGNSWCSGSEEQCITPDDYTETQHGKPWL